MSGTNTNKEQLQYNGKEQDGNNIVFDPHQLFEPCQKFYGTTQPVPLMPKFWPTSKILWTHASHAKIAALAIF